MHKQLFVVENVLNLMKVCTQVKGFFSFSDALTNSSLNDVFVSFLGKKFLVIPLSAFIYKIGIQMCI